MEQQRLAGTRVAFLANDGFEQDELSGPNEALRDAGARTDLVSASEGRVMAWRGKEWGWEFPVDFSLESANPEHYDGLVVPGGVMSADSLRMHPAALDFVRHFITRGKPVAAIGHAPWVLIDAEGVRGRKTTSFTSLRSDLTNAGAEWFDAGVVVDGNLVTSRTLDDLPAFVEAVVEVFEQRPAARQERPGLES